MKVFKNFMVMLAIITFIFEGHILGLNLGIRKELDSVKTSHTSITCEVAQTDAGYTYKLNHTTYSESDYINKLEQSQKKMNEILAVQGILFVLFAATATAAGRNVKKREQFAQPAVCC